MSFFLGPFQEVCSIDLFVQMLSSAFLRSYGKDIINIHHCLLPSFMGGNPSKQVVFMHFMG